MMAATPDPWDLVERILAADPRPTDEEILQLAGGNEALANEVREILAADQWVDRVERAIFSNSDLDQDPDWQVGVFIDGRFRIDEMISDSGGFGVVFRGTEFTAGSAEKPIRDVAIKVFKDLDADDSWEQEIDSLEGLGKLAGVVDLVTAGRDGWNRPYIVSAFVPGSTLDELIDQNRKAARQMDDGDVRRYLVEVLRALVGVHAFRPNRMSDARNEEPLEEAAEGDQRTQAIDAMVHCDIKPANVIIDSRDDRAVLIDFGISRIASRSSSGSGMQYSGHLGWSPSYQVPESAVARGGSSIESRPDARSDLFQVGLIGYEMLSNRRYWDDEPSERRRELRKPFRLWSPRRWILGRVLGRALEWEPDARYDSAQKMLRDLEPSWHLPLRHLFPRSVRGWLMLWAATIVVVALLTVLVAVRMETTDEKLAETKAELFAESERAAALEEENNSVLKNSQPQFTHRVARDDFDRIEKQVNDLGEPFSSTDVSKGIFGNLKDDVNDYLRLWEGRFEGRADGDRQEQWRKVKSWEELIADLDKIHGVEIVDWVLHENQWFSVDFDARLIRDGVTLWESPATENVDAVGNPNWKAGIDWHPDQILELVIVADGDEEKVQLTIRDMLALDEPLVIDLQTLDSQVEFKITYPNADLPEWSKWIVR